MEQLQRTARANRRLRAQLVALAFVLVVALIAGLVAVGQRDRAQESAADADAAAVAADARRVGAQALVAEDIDRSLLLAIEGVRLDDSTDTRANLLAALSRNPALVRSARGDDALITVDVSPDGKVVAVGGPFQGLSLRDADSLDELGSLGEPPGRFQFRPDGEQIAVVANPYSIEQFIEFAPLPAILVDATTFEQERAQLGGQPGPYSIAADLRYSADGRYLAVTFDLLGEGEEDLPSSSVVAVWDVTAPEHPIRRIDLPPSPFGTEAYSVALSPDGTLLYVSAVDPPHVTVYEVATGEPLRSAPGQGGPLQLNPDGTLLAVPDGNEIVLLDAATLGERGRLRGHTALVRAVRFSHDGGLLASASDDRTAIVWNLGAGDRQEQLRGHAGGVWDVEFSADDATLYTVSVDQAVLAWDLDGDRHLMPRMAIAEPVVSDPATTLAHVAHSAPTGDAVAYLTTAQAGAAEQTVTIQWLDVATGRAGEIVDTGHGDVGAHAWRPDGRRFATTGEDGFVRVWDWWTEELVAEHQVARGHVVGLDYTSDGTRLVVGEQGGSEQGGRLFAIDAETLDPTGRAVRFDHRIVSVAASPDNRTAIALTAEPGFAFVDLEVGRVIREGPLGGGPVEAGFSPDGQRVAISLGGSVGILDVETGSWVRTPVDGHDLEVRSLAYAPDGTIVASGSDDGRVGLWDGRTGSLLGTMLPGRPNTAVTVQFLPDGHTVLISSVDGNLYTWDTRVQTWVDYACGVAGRNLIRDEWRDAFGNRPYHRTCPPYPAGN